MSGNFEIGLGNLNDKQKSGKSQFCKGRMLVKH